VSYSCPEALEGGQYIPVKHEIWSLGVLLYVLLFQKDPFKTNDEILNLDLERELQSKYSRKDSKISCNSISALTSMLQKDPRKRATLNEILDMPIFKSF
jgi:serine/threonine protein kinase